MKQMKQMKQMKLSLFEADDVLMIVMIFFPHLSLNVLINKVLSQRNECVVSWEILRHLSSELIRNVSLLGIDFKQLLSYTIKQTHA